jgi:hypothetical protein
MDAVVADSNAASDSGKYSGKHRSRVSNRCSGRCNAMMCASFRLMGRISVPVYSAQARCNFQFSRMKIYKYLFLKENLKLFRDHLLPADILRRLGA